MSLLEAPPVTPAVPRGPVTDPRRLGADNVANLTRLTDVEYECPHGTLPLDRTVRCDCWTPERVQALMGQHSPSAPDLCIDDQPEEDAVEAIQDPQEMHDWYMGEDARTIADVATRYGLTHKRVRDQFKRAGLTNKPRGTRRNLAGKSNGSVPVTPPAKPATPVSTYGDAVAQLEEQIRQVTDEQGRHAVKVKDLAQKGEDLRDQRERLIVARDALRVVSQF